MTLPLPTASATASASAFRPAAESTPFNLNLNINGVARRSTTLITATVNLAEAYSRTNPQFRMPGSMPRRCLTKPGEPVHNQGYDNSANDLILHVGDALERYTVLDLLGTGTFGQVVRCRDPTNSAEVAVKVIKRHAAFKNQAWIEISILRLLHHQRDSKHVVRFHAHFLHRDHLCLVFEMLSINLYQLLKQNQYRGLRLQMLRRLLAQLLKALVVLVRCGIIHCDLKPENILLADLNADEIKLIDFGSACQLEHPVYSYVQSRFYRSPEVLLGLPQYDSQIDMWSLGCVAAELFLGIPLFPGQNEMNMVSRIVDMLGPMPDLFLRRCRRTSKFFNIRKTVDGTSDVRTHALKTDPEYEQENNCTLPPSKQYFQQKSLEDIIKHAPWKSEPPHTEEIQLRLCFIDFLRGTLKVDPLERLTPVEAMQHPFIQTGSLLNGQPWIPPGRPRRLPRARPVMAIDIPSESGDNGAIFACSAPPLRGHPQQSSESLTRSSAVGIPNNAWPVPYSGQDAANFTTGSYVPPPAYYALGGVPVPSMGIPGHTTKPRMMRNGTALRPDPNSPRLHPLMMSYAGNSSRRPSQLHHSSSRESLRISHSRESLGQAHKIPSPGNPGNVIDEPIFPFGPDDESPSSRIPMMWGTPSSGASHGPSSYGHNPSSYGMPPPAPSSVGQGSSSFGSAVSYNCYGRAPMRLQAHNEADLVFMGNSNANSSRREQPMGISGDALTERKSAKYMEGPG